VFRDVGFDPQLYVSGERLGCVIGTSFVDDIRSASTVSDREDESHISSPRKLSSLCRVVDANHRGVNNLRVLEENTFQLSWRYCKDDQC
jgi:hypothetical protein